MESPKNLVRQNTGDHISLVFLHYFGGAAKSWQFVISDLEEDFNCIAVDLPGFGGTPAPEQPSLAKYAAFVKEHLKSLSVSEYILIGHSMGGKIALQCVLDDQEEESIKALILIAPSPPSFEDIPKSKQEQMRQVPDQDQSIKGVEDDTVIKLEDERLAIAIQSPLEVDPASRVWWIDEGIHHSIAGRTKNIKIPVTVLVSEMDPAITMKMTVEEILPNLPAASKVEQVCNIGHLMPLEDPELVAALIRKTLD